MEKFIISKILKADLIEVDRQLRNNGYTHDMSTIILIKKTFVAISNLVDFERIIRNIYKNNNSLSTLYKISSKEFEFIQYLRNKYAGHIQPDLLTVAIQWKPEMRYLLNEIDKAESIYFYNICILETAINTYVDQDGRHKVFDSETDLSYPPDFKRFLIFLEKVISTAITYLNEIGKEISKDIEMLDPSQQNIEHWLAAGKTEFKYLKK
ncbi:hypothetical protein ACEN3H_13730 [Acinetobacter lactucae]|uniref:hypothetical protein n=1 Tax=Acinetobacter lactucae TaxID=1785128 RepID=UPI00358DA28F